MSLKLRKVNKIEQSVMHWSVNTMILLESPEPITFEDLKEALRLTVQKYSYLRLRTERNSETGEIFFVENSPNDVENYSIIWNLFANENEFDDWFTRFNMFGSKLFLRRLFDIEVDVYCDKRYRLYFRINHAGCDGRGIFAILNDLLGNLDEVVRRSQPGKIESKIFLDVHENENLYKMYDLEELKSEKVFRDARQEFFGQKLVLEKDCQNLSKLQTSYVGQFIQLEPTESKLLFDKCKKHESSVQGLLSTLKMVCLLNETCDMSTTESYPLELINTIPCDMRYCLGLLGDDLIKGGASLIWTQKINRSDCVWKTAREASKEISRQRQNNEGLKNWMKILNSLGQPKVSLWCSSMGKVSLDEDRLKSIKIVDMRFFISAPDQQFEINPTRLPMVRGYIHAFTFNDRLNITLSQTFPSLSLAWGQLFMDNLRSMIIKIIQSRDDGPSIGEILDKLKKPLEG